MIRSEYIATLAPVIQKYCVAYGIKVASPIIAQAIVEGLFWNDETNRSEESILAFQYHNYFGMMAFDDWKGRKVNLATWEEFDPGVRTDTTSNFRVYDSIEDGIRGYFEFIQYPRYSNLFETNDPYEYCRLLKADGWATASAYVDTLIRIIDSEHLTVYDNLDHIQPADVSVVNSPSDNKNGSEWRKIVFYDGLETGFSVEYYGSYRCAVDALNVRTGAGTDFDIMTCISKGTMIMCNGFFRVAEDMIWMLIQFYGENGDVYCGWASAGTVTEAYFERI